MALCLLLCGGPLPGPRFPPLAIWQAITEPSKLLLSISLTASSAARESPNSTKANPRFTSHEDISPKSENLSLISDSRVRELILPT